MPLMLRSKATQLGSAVHCNLQYGREASGTKATISYDPSARSQVPSVRSKSADSMDAASMPNIEIGIGMYLDPPSSKPIWR